MIQPGTRCECRDSLHNCSGTMENTNERCPRDAVRLVTVREEVAQAAINPSVRVRKFARRAVPMCEPCAAWHEARRS